MNKEENYRNLAGNITAFTDNTMFYEDWLVIQQYVDDWLDEIDKLQQENQLLKDRIEKAIEYTNKIELDNYDIYTANILLDRNDGLIEILKGE